MKWEVGKNICRYRKEQGVTQEELAKGLGISFQAVSKWETGQTYPDITLLPELARTLEVSIDRLMGHGFQTRPVTIYEKEYDQADYYWGIEPARACYELLSLRPPVRPLTLLDIGCGEGKDAVFFARNGYHVTAFDVADTGVEKTKRLADRIGVGVEVFKADILDFRLDQPYDILYSNGVMHYIKPELRREIFANYKKYTNEGGVHSFSAFVEKPFISSAPEAEPYSYLWRSGELISCYYDWRIIECAEDIFDCVSSGIPHRHAMSRVIAEKVTTSF